MKRYNYFTKSGDRVVSIAFRLNVRLRGGGGHLGERHLGGVGVSIAFRLNVRLRVGADQLEDLKRVLKSQLPFG